MIERHHYLKFKAEYATPEERETAAARTLEVLPTVPGVLGVTVGVPADDAAIAPWDLMITVRFPSLAEIEPYRAHPDHRRFVDEFLAPRVEVKKNWNFEARTV